jgi:hypothetical protein
MEGSGSQGVRLQDIWPINQPTNAAKRRSILGGVGRNCVVASYGHKGIEYTH